MKGRLLVVDDEHGILVALKGLFGKEGYEVETAESGEEALAKVKAGLFHVIITVDLRHIAGMRIGELSNYIALLALVTSRPSQACQPLPSIANLLANGCSKDQRPEELSPYDLAFLRAVYRMDTYASLPDQRSAIVDKIMRDMTPR